jgi:hypothetical protein
MSKSQKKKKSPKSVMALPELEQSKSAVLNSLASKSGQRTYDHARDDFVDWYCSEPRLAFNRTVVLREQRGQDASDRRYRIQLRAGVMRHDLLA